MCMFPAAPAAPQLPREYAAMQPPDGNAVRTAAQRRAMDRSNSRSPTILTSGSGVAYNAPLSRVGLGPTILTSSQGVTMMAPIEKKNILG